MGRKGETVVSISTESTTPLPRGQPAETVCETGVSISTESTTPLPRFTGEAP